MNFKLFSNRPLFNRPPKRIFDSGTAGADSLGRAGSEQNPHHMKLDGSTFVFSVFDGGQRIVVCHFGRGWHLNEGDFVIFEQRDGETTRYKITERRTPMDPGDQHFLDCKFAPRAEPVPNNKAS